MAKKKVKTTSTKLILDTRYKKQTSNTFPVRLRVTNARKQKYYTLKHSLTEHQWKKMYGRTPGDKLKDILFELNDEEKKAKDIIKKIMVFSFDIFEKKYLNSYDTSGINGCFDTHIQQLREEGRIGTAVSYECAKASINKFEAEQRGIKYDKAKFKSTLNFIDIDAAYLNKYEKWIGNPTTAGIYLRSLRSIFNLAIKDGSAPPDIYPFKTYEIPTSINTKKALTLAEIGQIISYECDGLTACMKDYWLFLYLCNGMNVKDMSLLKWENITGKILEYKRAKTLRTKKRNIKSIRVSLKKITQEIIMRRGSGKEYIFPILEATDTPERQYQKIQNLTSLINTHMKFVAKGAGVEKPCLTYSARHSFASVLKRSGASTEFISESLGHSNVITTENYLDSFEDEKIHDTTDALIPKTAIS